MNYGLKMKCLQLKEMVKILQIWDQRGLTPWKFFQMPHKLKQKVKLLQCSAKLPVFDLFIINKGTDNDQGYSVNDLSKVIRMCLVGEWH
jgi:hypothetical protein